MIDAFFYGLFMDSELLANLGVNPENPRRARVDDYQLHIGERATLLPSAGSRAYGMAFSLTQEELDSLYSDPGLRQYQPERVTARDMQGGAFAALCYVLPVAPEASESNKEYAGQLRELLGRLGFPSDYIESIS